ncbi:MAG TPA: hypothetical protein VGI70_19265 [Polyangiales bacterium]
MSIACQRERAPKVELMQVPLFDAAKWRAYPADQDPLASHQPAEVSCGISGFYMEYGHLEVDTNFCNYLLAEHPASVAIDAGTAVTITLSHYDLNAAEPATAHAAIIFGDTVIWETYIDIPQPANVLTATVRIPEALAMGEQIRMHLHNHGQNNYTLVGIDAALPCADGGCTPDAHDD